MTSNDEIKLELDSDKSSSVDLSAFDEKINAPWLHIYTFPYCGTREYMKKMTEKSVVYNAIDDWIWANTVCMNGEPIYLKILQVTLPGMNCALEFGLNQWLNSEEVEQYDVVVLKKTMDPSREWKDQIVINQSIWKNIFIFDASAVNPFDRCGMLVLSKYRPTKIFFGFPSHFFQDEGRVLALDFPDLTIIVFEEPIIKDKYSYQTDKLWQLWSEEVMKYTKFLFKNFGKPLVIICNFGVKRTGIDWEWDYEQGQRYSNLLYNMHLLNVWSSKSYTFVDFKRLKYGIKFVDRTPRNLQNDLESKYSPDGNSFLVFQWIEFNVCKFEALASHDCFETNSTPVAIKIRTGFRMNDKSVYRHFFRKY